VEVQGSISKTRLRPFLWLLALALFVALTYVVLAAQAGSQPERACEFGAISAIGPVDAAGNGDTTPEVRCLP
jgi:hypothetical protein